MDYKMTPFEKEMERNLLEMQQAIQSKINKTDDDFRSVIGSMGIKDSIDLASDELATKKMEAVSQIDVGRLKAVEQALIRLRNGKYGVCEQCGKKIPEDRLRALPYALLCVECKSLNEKRHF
ncbi:MAG: TraR/DksA family transcriptional regulator [Sphaerochaetaceae bacterium]|nr:TraR/DksA family transcriptional regulator [Sphaerochaetaceae bacterium]